MRPALNARRNGLMTRYPPLLEPTQGEATSSSYSRIRCCDSVRIAYSALLILSGAANSGAGPSIVSAMAVRRLCRVLQLRLNRYGLIRKRRGPSRVLVPSDRRTCHVPLLRHGFMAALSLGPFEPA